MPGSCRSRVTVSKLVIFDTSIFIDHLRTGRHQQRLESTTGLIRTSSVVLAELWRGAAKPAERKFLRALERNHPILTPTEKTGWSRARYSEKFTPTEDSRPTSYATCISTYSSHSRRDLTEGTSVFFRDLECFVVSSEPLAQSTCVFLGTR